MERQVLFPRRLALLLVVLAGPRLGLGDGFIRRGRLVANEPHGRDPFVDRQIQSDQVAPVEMDKEDVDLALALTARALQQLAAQEPEPAAR